MVPGRISVVGIAASILFLAACDTGPSYGSNSLTNFTPRPLQSPTPTPSPIKSNPIAVQTSPTHSQPPPTLKPAPTQAQVVQVSINAEGPNYFDPPTVIVSAGSIVRWTNTDTQDSPRVLKADNGAFTSPPIPPGGSWQYTFSTPGNYQYHDQRPYAGGEVQVR